MRIAEVVLQDRVCPLMPPFVDLSDSNRDGVTMFRRMCDAFDEGMAACRGGADESDHVLAGRRMRLRVLGEQLARTVRRPFAHLQSAEDESPRVVALRIDLWDEGETGVACPIDSSDLAALGPTWTVDGGTLTASADGRVVAYCYRESMTWLDRKSRHMVGSVACAERLSLHERGKPFPVLLSIWHTDHDVQVMHAALVADGSQGVLFPGGSGSGKSTCAMVCADAGFHYLADDYVGLQTPPDGACVGYSLYSSTRLDPAHLQRFPFLHPHVIPARPPFETKSLIFVSEVFPERLERRAAIRAIALPRIVDLRESRFRAASRAETLLALIPTSIFAMVPNPGARGVDRLTKLVESVPAYRLELGSDLQEVPRRVRELLSAAGS